MATWKKVLTSGAVSPSDITGSDGTANQILQTNGNDAFSWVTPDSGDITSVVAGTNISGGGESGAVTLNLETTLGDMAGVNFTTTGGTIDTDAITGENQVGGALAIKAGAGTGTGVGGNIEFSVAKAGGVTGSDANTLSNTFTINQDGNVYATGEGHLGSLLNFTGTAGITLDNAVGTNQVGGELKISSGYGTGTGTGGEIGFYTAPAGSSSDTVNAKVLAMSISGEGDVTVSNDLTISGDLTVSGTTTTVNTETINLADNVIYLNSNLDSSTAPSQDGGITINRGSSTDQSFFWEETDDRWAIGVGEHTSGVMSSITGFMTTVQIGEDANAPATTADGSGVGSMWMTTAGVPYIRTV